MEWRQSLLHFILFVIVIFIIEHFLVVFILSHYLLIRLKVKCSTTFWAGLIGLTFLPFRCTSGSVLLSHHDSELMYDLKEFETVVRISSSYLESAHM